MYVGVEGRRAERRRDSELGSCCCLLEVGDEVVAVLVLLQASERHLRTRNVLQNNQCIELR